MLIPGEEFFPTGVAAHIFSIHFGMSTGVAIHSSGLVQTTVLLEFHVYNVLSCQENTTSHHMSWSFDSYGHPSPSFKVFSGSRLYRSVVNVLVGARHLTVRSSLQWKVL